MRTDCLKIEKFEVLEVDREILFDGLVECTVTVDLQCGLRIDGYVTCDGDLNPDWSTFDPIKVDGADEDPDTFGA